MPVAVASRDKPDRHLAVGHSCVDYPITFYVASKAHNSGSVVAPRIIASSCIYFGQGHPLNRTEVLYPDSDGYMPDGAIVSPRLSIISRRSLLLALLRALVSVKDIYRVGRAATCLHINVSSQYLDIVWNKWLPDWEKNGWPTREEDDAFNADRRSIISRKGTTPSIRSQRSQRSQHPRDRADSRASARMSMMSRADSTISAMTSDAQLIYDDDSSRLINEDLLRKIAVFRRNFFKNTKVNSKGAAYVQLISYRQNPADRLAKESVSAASLDLTTQLPRPRSLGPSRTSSRMGASSIFSSETDNLRPSNAQGAHRPKTSSLYNQSMSRKGNSPALSSLQETREAKPVAVAAHSLPTLRAENHATKSPPVAVASVSSPNSTPGPTPVSATATVAAAAPIDLAATAVQNPKMRSRASVSGYDTEGVEEEFNDAASTLSNEDQEPASAIAKIVSLPTAVIAATVAALMVPSTKTKESEILSPSVDEAASKRGSFAIETEEALAAVKIPANEPTRPVKVPKRISSYGQPKSNGVPNGTERVPSIKARKSSEVRRDQSLKERKSGEITRQTSQKTRRSGEITRQTSQKTRRSGEVTRETSNVSRRSVRSNAPLTLEESNKLARSISARSATRRPVIEEPTAEPIMVRRPTTPPSAPKESKSIFSSLRGMNKRTESFFKSNKSSEPYLPPMDRLIDYRPPQSRNLRTNQFGEQGDKITSSALNSPSKEEKLEKIQSPTSSRGGPFSFFKKRGKA